MSDTWKTVRIFISSTFRDMHAERDHLVKVVFPELRERLLPHRVHLVDVDLRWGVTKEQADDDRVLDLCLKQIDECRPFFLGILGQRYGWVPEHFPADALKDYGWIQLHSGKSVTELEITHGVLTNPQMQGSAFFYFRDPAYLPAVPQSIRSLVYQEEDADATAKLEDLKGRIRSSGLPVFDGYPVRWDGDAYDRPSRTHGRLVGLEAFGRRVFEQLWTGIRLWLGRPDVVDAAATESDIHLTGESDYHERFMESRLRVYAGRESVNDALVAFANGEDPVPCLLTAPSGLGKSAALARFVTTYRQANPDALVIPHFVGASPRSTSLRGTLRRLCLILQKRFGFAGDLPDDSHQLAAMFRGYIASVPSSVKVVLAIDGLNQFDEADQPHELYWLPWQPPPHVKVIASCIADPSAEGAGSVLRRFGENRHRPCLIEPLRDDERHEIVAKVPSLSAKTLDEDQINLLLSNPATANPLFLLVALEELRGFGSFEHLNDQIAGLPRTGDTVTAIFEQVIDRLEEEFDPDLVRSVLTLLASARLGLSEAELAGLLKEQKTREGIDGQAEFHPVLRQLRPYLHSRAGLWSFYHANLLKAVTDCYLVAPDRVQAAHARLAAYFDHQPLKLSSAPGGPVNRRKVEEQPWQLARAGNWSKLYALLADPAFFKAAWASSEYEVRTYWAQVEANSSLRMIDAYRPVLEGQVGDAAFVADLGLLLRSSHPKESLALFERLTEQFRQTGNAENLQTTLGNQAGMLQARGDLDAAMRLLREQEQICRELRNPVGLQCSLGNQALILKTRGDLNGAMRLLKDQELICRELGNLDELQRSLGNQALVLMNLGYLDEAIRLLREQEKTCRETGNLDGRQASLAGQALIHQNRGDVDGAMQLLQEAERICRDLGNVDGLHQSLHNQACILYARGDLDGSMRLFQEEERACRELSNVDGLQASLGNQALILMDRGDLDGAMRLHKEQERICRELGDVKGLQLSLGNQGKILYAKGDVDGAMRLHQEQERICRELRNPEGLQRSLGSQAVLLRDQGDLDGAMRLHQEEERICRELGNVRELQRSLGCQVTILHARGDLDGTLRLLQEQEQICHDLRDMAGLTAVQQFQASILMTRGDLNGPMRLFQDQEQLYREQGKVDGIISALVEQALLLMKGGARPEQALPLAEEAYQLAVHHGLAAMVRQIMPMLEKLRSMVR